MIRDVIVTVSDSLLRPLVMKEKPCVSIATPVRWMCSSTYLQKKQGQVLGLLAAAL